MCSCEGPVFGDWIYAGALWADEYRSPPTKKMDVTFDIVRPTFVAFCCSSWKKLGPVTAQVGSLA